MEIVRYFIYFASKITADSDCSHEIQRHLLLERKAVTNLDRILKKKKSLYRQNEFIYCYLYYPGAYSFLLANF